MLLCPNCESSNTVKNGFSHNRQRYMCDDCLYSFTVFEWPKVPLKTKQTILKAIFRQKSIAKYLKRPMHKVSRATIHFWLKQLKKNIVEIELIKTEKRWLYYQRTMLENLQNAIKKRKWKHPLTTRQVIELSDRYLDTLMLLVQHRPFPAKNIQKKPRKCRKKE